MIVRIVLLLSVCTTGLVAATSYKDGELVSVYVNKVGPYFNPQETYAYYSLPVCRPEKIKFRQLSLGEVLVGDRLAESLYKINFRKNVNPASLCTVSFTQEELEQVRSAVEDLYYFEFVMDELRVRGFLGRMQEYLLPYHRHHLFLWTHHHFRIEYNGDKIIYASINTTLHQPLRLDNITKSTDQVTVDFTYSVEWVQTDYSYANREELQKKSRFFRKNMEIHWLSVFNSALLVVLLMGFMAIILMRVLKSDMARYNAEDEEVDDSANDDYGWKIIHSDVFRLPPHKSILCAVLGCGAQFLALFLGLILMAWLDLFNVHKHGAMNTACVLLYALTSGVAGYVSARFFRELDGHNWVWNIVLTSSLFAAPFFFVWSLVNSVAWYNQSTQALPFTTILLLMLVWLLVGFPLTVVGGITGRHHAEPFKAPCRTKNIAREIPAAAWYYLLPLRMLVGGFLPFSSISVELYYVFATLWGRQTYTLYGILLIVFFIVVSMTACIAIVLTYFQLRSEDYRWWWQSVFTSGATGIFVFFYSVFYFYYRSQMSGFLQSIQFFGYTVLVCYVFFLTLGTIGFYASLRFTRYIYSNLKMD